MITIKNDIVKKQPNFWNHILFHPTDAIEDPWGKRILDRIAADGAAKTVRIYSMFEDIVYLNEKGELQYDWRLSDLRLDYLLEKGYDLLIAYGGMPDCIASSTGFKTSASFNKTRYKGKMWNSMPPKNYALWEEICYEYTMHNIRRYGLERVTKWHLQCFNEPDIPAFFMSNLPESAVAVRSEAYNKMYAGFERGIRRASEKLTLGGPCLAYNLDFLKQFLNFVKTNDLRLDFISMHNYGTSPELLNNGEDFSVEHNVKKQKNYLAAIRDAGFQHTPIIVDEWGMASCGFHNRTQCPHFLARETEMMAAYFIKLIHAFIREDFKIEQLMICLSGQHEMTEDFSGFRNFFTLNFIAKPIYNAYRMASELGEDFLAAEYENEHLAVLPTRKEDGQYAVLLTYAAEHFQDNLPAVEETLTFPDAEGKTFEIYCIDRLHTNPYRLHEKGITDLDVLREEGQLKAWKTLTYENCITLPLTANSTYLIMEV